MYKQSAYLNNFNSNWDNVETFEGTFKQISENNIVKLLQSFGIWFKHLLLMDQLHVDSSYIE